MDLDAIGAHCALATCNEHDFLPIQCDCLQRFCRFHISPDSHTCKASRKTLVTPQGSPAGRARCTLLGCNKPLLTSLTGGMGDERTSAAGCSACGLSFCVHHRHQQSHTCSGLACQANEVNRKLTQSRAPFLFNASSSYTPMAVRRCKGPSTNPTKSAHLQKINGMKMRLRSVPGDPKHSGSLVPIDQRIHVNVYYEADGSSQPRREGTFWFQKSIATGRVLDLLANRFDIPPSKTSSLTLCRADDLSELPSHLPLSDSVVDASSLMLRLSPSA
ncbi:hypothetical protein PISMIDRAFT_670391 [Pisolithus microcarpus 441]|uniref:AN1-type domain-containing protein n=1 Tax=Pisolithus microcarpus 441 TaxID=765257 RepID=A0A0D0AAR8_9AGAM|nr:hypothetical protein PISMIDRAFT_670391 [Pisolithus microcarpus 441]